VKTGACGRIVKTGDDDESLMKSEVDCLPSTYSRHVCWNCCPVHCTKPLLLNEQSLRYYLTEPSISICLVHPRSAETEGLLCYTWVCISAKQLHTEDWRVLTVIDDANDNVLSMADKGMDYMATEEGIYGKWVI